MMKMAMKMTRCSCFRVRASDPLPGAPKMSWETTATYGTKSPFLVRRGDGTLHKERKSVEQHGRDHTGSIYLGSGRREA